MEAYGHGQPAWGERPLTMKEACEIGAAKSVDEDNVLQYLCREGGGLEEEVRVCRAKSVWSAWI